MGCQASHVATPTFLVKAARNGKKMRGDGKPQPLKMLRGRDIPLETMVQAAEWQSAGDEWDLRSEHSLHSRDEVVCLVKVVPLLPGRHNDEDHLCELNTFLKNVSDNDLHFRLRVGKRRKEMQMMHDESEKENDWSDMLSTEVPWQRNESTASKSYEAASSNASTSASEKSCPSSDCSSCY